MSSPSNDNSRLPSFIVKFVVVFVVLGGLVLIIMYTVDPSFFHTTTTTSPQLTTTTDQKSLPTTPSTTRHSPSHLPSPCMTPFIEASVTPSLTPSITPSTIPEGQPCTPSLPCPSGLTCSGYIAPKSMCTITGQSCTSTCAPAPPFNMAQMCIMTVPAIPGACTLSS